jgi:O-antigen/teichoic acid export membrane protein
LKRRTLLLDDINMARSVKANYLFNLINSASQLLFPLITFPYASRIMMADGIGQVNFFQSIISYISLFTCLGIPMYAIREIAKVRDNLEKMTRTTVEILLLHAFLTLFGYIIVAAICMTVAKVQTDIPLFLILSVSIFFTAIGCEWFYQGIEDFKYVAIRGIVVKTVSVLLLFLLVKSKEDILWYGAYTVFGVLGGNIFNFIRLRKYLHRDFVGFSKLHLSDREKE